MHAQEHPDPEETPEQPPAAIGPELNDLLSVTEILDTLTEGLTETGYLAPEPITDQRRYSGGAREIVAGLLRRFDLREAGMRYEDLYRMHTDEVGNMLRRPVLAEYLIGIIESFPAESEVQRSIRTGFLNSFRSAGYRYFEAVESERIDLKEELDRCPQDPGFTSRLLGFIHEELAPIRTLEERLNADYLSSSHEEWVTDPGHGLSLLDMGKYFWVSIGRSARSELSLPVSFLHVDDDRWATWYEISNFIVSDIGRAQSVYSAEEALSTLENAKLLPDVILSDVDMGDGLNGIDLAIAIRENAAERDEKTQIYLYTSGYERHRERMQDLQEHGVIQGYFAKQSF